MPGDFAYSRKEGLTAFLARAAACAALACIALLFVMVFSYAVPVVFRQGAEGIFSWAWNPYKGEFGILAMLAGSLILAASSMLLACPLALALCCWTLTARAGLPLMLVRGCLRLMTAVPTVVYGFAAVFLLTPLVRAGLGGSGLCWFSAAVMLCLLILPAMVLILEAGLAPRLDKLCPGGLATGFDRFELLWFFVLPEARRALLAAAALGFGRAVGDTLLPLMLAGNAPHVPHALADSMRTLTAHMALVTANEVGGAAYGSLFVAGALLLGINTLVSLLMRRLGAPSTGGGR